MTRSLPTGTRYLSLTLVLLLLLVPSVYCGRDYYDLLGVPRDAEKSVIKRAYHQMAKRYHPDKHPGDKKMETKFKDISTAYEVLTDKQQRQVYDQFGEEGLKQNQGGGGGGGGFHHHQRGGFGGDSGGFQFEIDPEMFGHMFGNGGGFGGGGGGGRQQQRQQHHYQQRRKVCFENKVCENNRCYMQKECKS